MLNIKLCKKILNKNSNKYNDEQVEQIRDFITLLAEIHVDNQKNQKDEKKSSHLHQGINGHTS
jgi:hypothetical protein